jgi:hypothetical protein
VDISWKQYKMMNIGWIWNEYIFKKQLKDLL